jgi:putative two-component system response regulator
VFLSHLPEDIQRSERPYKNIISVEDSLGIIKNESEKHFDPSVVKKFIEILPSIEKKIKRSD